MPGTLFVVATPIGNLEDITARAVRVLKEVALIAAEDTRRTAKLLAHYGIRTRTTSLHQHNERSKSHALLRRLKEGEDIALVSDAGTPTVSDPGHHLVRLAIDEGIRLEPIPGPNAIIAALSVAGLEGGPFTFLGFPPARAQARKNWLQELSRVSGVAVFFEAPHRIRQTLEEVLRALGDCQGVMARELTKVHEELVRGPISTLLNRLERPQGEFTVVLVIGHKPELTAVEAHGVTPTDDSIATEFRQMTDSSSMTRREIISELSRRHRLPSRVIYQILEKHKNSVE